MRRNSKDLIKVRSSFYLKHQFYLSFVVLVKSEKVEQELDFEVSRFRLRNIFLGFFFGIVDELDTGESRRYKDRMRVK